MEKSCAFTGHRILSGGFDVNLLDRVVLNLIKSGVNKFYSGMAKGFDLIAAESVINFKKEFKVSLCACIPYKNQPENFSESDAERYKKILENCDDAVIFSDEYFSGCMQTRDRFLVDNSDVLVCYLRKKYGGTFYTVNYARKKNKKIIEL